MNRRTFVRNSTFAAMAMAATPAFAKGATRKKTGIQLYTVRGEMKNGLDSVLGKLSSVGYQTVEMYGYGNGNYFGKSMAETAALLKKHQLTSPSAHIGLAEFLHKGNDDVWKKAVDDALIIGNKYLVIPWIDEAHRKTADDYKKIAVRLNRAAELSKAGGLKFAYHNHAFEFQKFGDTTGYDILLTETDAATVKMELDLFWVKNAGFDSLDLFAKHPGRFTLWHVKDMDKQDKNKQTEVGNGSIDFKKIFAAQKKAGMEYFFVEQENYDVSPYTSIEQSIAYVKQHLV